MKKKICYLIVFCISVLLLTACSTNSDDKEDGSSDQKVQKTTKTEKFGDINLEIPEEWTVSTDEESTSIKPDNSGDVVIIAFYNDAVKSVDLDLTLSVFAMGVGGGEGTSDLEISDTQLSGQPAKELKYNQIISGTTLNVHGYAFPVLDKFAYIAIAEKEGCAENYHEEFEEIINGVSLPQNTLGKE